MLDWPGQVTIVAAFLDLLFGVIEGPERGWRSVSVLGAFVVLMAAFVLIETRARAPMPRLGLFRILALSAASWPFLVVQSVTPFIWPLLARVLRAATRGSCSSSAS